MSLEAIDEGMKKKLSSVYANVVFGPLERAFVNSCDMGGDVLEGNDLISSDPNNWVINQEQNTNPQAELGVPSTYSSTGIDRDHKSVVKFPMLAFDRISNGFGIDYQANDPMTRKGRYVIDDKIRERSFTVTPQYQIDCISDRRKDVDALWREIVFFLLVHNSVDVEYHNGDTSFTESFPIQLLDTDNTTDVDSFTDKGVIYRQTITLEVTNAKMLFQSNTKLIETIPIRYVEM